MHRNLIYATICLAILAVCLKFANPAGFLFFVLTGYFVYKSIQRKPATKSARPIGPIIYGILDTYAVDNDPKDLSFGMYIELLGKPVFLDIREDKYLEQRKQHALFLNQNKDQLEEHLRVFILRNPKFQNFAIVSIGLHSDDLERGEVFWEPDGYTLLRNLEFVPN